MQKIYWRLLVARRWIFEVCQCALELEGVVVVLNESRRDGRVEGNARQAFISEAGVEDDVAVYAIFSVRTCYSRTEGSAYLGH